MKTAQMNKPVKEYNKRTQERQNENPDKETET